MYKRWEPSDSKRSLRAWLKIIRRLKTWQLLIILILLSFIAATFLRLNNLEMIDRRDAVVAADKKGDKAATKVALLELQRYVSAHMNTSLEKGVALEQTFQRDYQAAVEAAASAHNPESDIYQKASLECQARFQGGVASFRNDYVACVAAAVANLPANQPQTVQLPRGSAYTYNFASPLISFDLAGIAVALVIALSLFIFIRLVALYWLKWLIRKRQKVF